MLGFALYALVVNAMTYHALAMQQDDAACSILGFPVHAGMPKATKQDACSCMATGQWLEPAISPCMH